MFGQLGVGIMTSLPSPCSKREWKTAVTSKFCSSTKAQLAGESKKKNTYPWCIFWEGKGHWLLELSCPSSRLSSIHDIGMCVFFKAKEPLPSRHCKQSCAQDQQLSCTPAKNSGNSTGDTTRLPHYQVLKTPFLMSWCSFGVKKMEKANLKRRFSCHCINSRQMKKSINNQQMD